MASSSPMRARSRAAVSAPAHRHERSGRTPRARPELRTVTKVLVISPAAADAASLEIAGPALRYRQLAGELRRNGVEVTLATRGPGGDADWSLTRPLELARGHDRGRVPAGPRRRGGRARPPPAADCALVHRLLRACARRARAARPRRRAFRRLPPPRARRARARRSAARRQSAAARVRRRDAVGDRARRTRAHAAAGAPGAHGRAAAAGAAGDPATPRVLWYGGLWPWFDGATAVQAFALVAREQPDARLRILGGRHPRGEAPDTLDAVLAAGNRSRRRRARREPPLGVAGGAAGHARAGLVRALPRARRHRAPARAAHAPARPAQRRRSHRLHAGRRARRRAPSRRAPRRPSRPATPRQPRARSRALLGDARGPRARRPRPGAAWRPSWRPSARWPRPWPGWPPRARSARAAAPGARAGAASGP